MKFMVRFCTRNDKPGISVICIEFECVKKLLIYVHVEPNCIKLFHFYIYFINIMIDDARKHVCSGWLLLL